MKSPNSVFHPFLLALYPVLLLYSRNVDQIYLRETFAAIVVLLLVTLAFWLTARSFWSDPIKAGLLTSGVLFVLFSFERNVYATKTYKLGLSPDLREWLILGMSLVGGAGGLLLLHCVPRIVRPLNTVANAGSIALLSTLLPGLFPAIVGPNPRNPNVVASQQLQTRSTNHEGRKPKQDPDIYWIVLDAFGRSDVLKSFFNYDNHEFIDRMERRGFYVARQSTSNYSQTALSVTATLNASYHDQLAGSPSKSRLPLRDLIRDAATLRLLRSRGYKLISFASGFGLTDGFPADERRAPRFDVSEFNELLLDMTPVWTILGEGAARASHRQHRDRILHVFNHLPEIADDPEPTFCFAHIVAPHPPFVFDSTGRDVSGADSAYRLTDGKSWSDLDGHGGPDDYARRYRNQAAYISERVERVVDQVLTRSPHPPVIVIQGDHGPASHFDSEDAHPNDLHERLSILNLAMIPGGGSERLYPSITPVNTFRVVCDHLFGTDQALLPDRNYYSSYQTPYRLFDVTDQLTAEASDLDPSEQEPAR